VNILLSLHKRSFLIQDGQLYMTPATSFTKKNTIFSALSIYVEWYRNTEYM